LLAFWHLLALTAPLFLLVLVGYVLSRWGRWPRAASDALTRFVFSVAIPAFLFRLMADFSRLPAVDARLLIAYFGGLLIVFVSGRVIAATMFHLDGSAQSVFAVGGIFSNIVLLGVPLVKITLGDASMPTASLVIVFNSLLLWTLVTVSVEWARHRELSVRGFAMTTLAVVRNPVVAGILCGTAFSFTGLTLPHLIDETVQLLSQAAIPMSLVVLGMGLSEYGIRAGWQQSAAIAALKLVVAPLTVYLIARALSLPPLETVTVVVMSSLPLGANVYLMAREFRTMEGPVASALVLTTALAAVTTPVLLALLGVAPR
jgi:malonate transporter and related proteins